MKLFLISHLALCHFIFSPLQANEAPENPLAQLKRLFADLDYFSESGALVTTKAESLINSINYKIEYIGELSTRITLSGPDGSIIHDIIVASDKEGCIMKYLNEPSREFRYKRFSLIHAASVGSGWSEILALCPDLFLGIDYDLVKRHEFAKPIIIKHDPKTGFTIYLHAGVVAKIVADQPIISSVTSSTVGGYVTRRIPHRVAWRYNGESEVTVKLLLIH
jgi:hypothetical protein